MRRHIIRSVIFVFLIAAMMAPVVESFDHWDDTPGLAGDTEFQVAALALVAGLFTVVAALVVTKLCAQRSPQTRSSQPVTGTVSLGATLPPFFPGCSPPCLQLRI
jgi:hypothetical protein